MTYARPYILKNLRIDMVSYDGIIIYGSVKIILFIVIVYIALMLGVGWWAGKHYIKGMTDFLLAGRRLGI